MKQFICRTVSIVVIVSSILFEMPLLEIKASQTIGKDGATISSDGDYIVEHSLYDEYGPIVITNNAKVNLTIDTYKLIKGKDAKDGSPSTPGIQVQSGCTLNLRLNNMDANIKGGNGWYMYPGSAGIEVQEGAVLNIVGGNRTLNVTGGNAGSGGSNMNGKTHMEGTSDADKIINGYGGGGAGAGIGGSGGDGGKGNSLISYSSFKSAMDHNKEDDISLRKIIFTIDDDKDKNGNDGNNCGTIKIDAPDLTINANGGSGGAAGTSDTTSGFYTKGDGSINVRNWGFAYEVIEDMYGGTGQRGTGGGGYPAAGIGGGGGGAGAGGAGHFGGYYYRPSSGAVFETGAATGGGGGGGGGEGYVDGHPGIGGVGKAFGTKYDNKPGSAGHWIHGGEGGKTSWGDGEYDGYDGYDGGYGGKAGTYESIQLKQGAISATATSAEGIGVGYGASTIKQGNLQIDPHVMLSVSSISKNFTNEENDQLRLYQLPLESNTSNVTINGTTTNYKSFHGVCWKQGRTYKVQYDISSKIRYEADAIGAESEIKLINQKLINPSTLNIQYSTVATGYEIRDAKTKEVLKDIREDLPGFQLELGNEIEIEIKYPNNSGYSTSGWSDGKTSTIWKGKVESNMDLTAYAASSTKLPSYTVGLKDMDFNHAKFTFHIAYESITENAKTLMIEPKGLTNHILTLHHDADPSVTMQIKIPDTEVFVRKDNGNKDKGEYDKVITGEILNPESIRAGSYSGTITFLVTYGLETKELDLSKGDITITGTGYKAENKSSETTFHGNYKIKQSNSSTNHSIQIGGDVAAQGFRISMDGLKTTGEMKMTNTNGIELNMNNTKLDSMTFTNSSNTQLNFTGTNELQTSKNQIPVSTSGMDVHSYYSSEIPDYKIVPYMLAGSNRFSLYNKKYWPLQTLAVDTVNFNQVSVQGAKGNVTQGAVTLQNSKVKMNLPNQKDTLKIGNTLTGTGLHTASTSIVLKNGSSLTVDGSGTINADSGQYYSNDLGVSSKTNKKWEMFYKYLFSDVDIWGNNYGDGPWNLIASPSATVYGLDYDKETQKFHHLYNIIRKPEFYSNTSDFMKRLEDFDYYEKPLPLTLDNEEYANYLFYMYCKTLGKKDVKAVNDFDRDWQKYLKYPPISGTATENPAISPIVVDANSDLTMNGGVLNLNIKSDGKNETNISAISGSVEVGNDVKTSTRTLDSPYMTDIVGATPDQIKTYGANTILNIEIRFKYMYNNEKLNHWEYISTAPKLNLQLRNGSGIISGYYEPDKEFYEGGFPENFNGEYSPGIGSPRYTSGFEFKIKPDGFYLANESVIQEIYSSAPYAKAKKEGTVTLNGGTIHTTRNGVSVNNVYNVGTVNGKGGK